VAVFLLSKYSIPSSATQAVAIGFIWLAFTLGFEFLFGRYVVGHSWTRLFQDYNLLSGRVWPLLLAWVTCLPYITYKCYEPAT
jgi:cytochrome bd-type quinol oxidase subunit 2